MSSESKRISSRPAPLGAPPKEYGPTDLEREREIEAKEKAATEGPWENVRPGGIPPGIVCDIDGESWDITEDADFIAHAREDIPYLLAQLREARKKLAAVKNYSGDLRANRDVLDTVVVARELDRILKGGD